MNCSQIRQNSEPGMIQPEVLKPSMHKESPTKVTAIPLSSRVRGLING